MKMCASEIRAEIAYYEAKANENDPAVTPAQRNLRKHYMRFVGRRKQLLAAFFRSSSGSLARLPKLVCEGWFE